MLGIVAHQAQRTPRRIPEVPPEDPAAVAVAVVVAPPWAVVRVEVIRQTEPPLIRIGDSLSLQVHHLMTTSQGPAVLTLVETEAQVPQS